MTITTLEPLFTSMPEPPTVGRDLASIVISPSAKVDDAEGDSEEGGDTADSDEEPGFEEDELGFEGGGFSPAELEEFDESDFDDDFDDDFEEDLDDDLDDKDEELPTADEGDDDHDEFDDE